MAFEKEESDRKSWVVTNIIIIISLLFIKQLNGNVGYGNGNGCDSWYFFGVYQSYFNLRSMLGDYYQFGRFPAILPWIFLGPRISVTALTDIKFWTYFLISLGSFSYAGVTLFGARIGSLISILFLGCTLYIGALSTDYVTGAGLAWECAAIATTIGAAKSERPAPWLFLTGALYACCVYTHIPMAMFIFSTPLYLFLRMPKPAVASLAKFLALMMIGFLVLTIILCLSSLALQGDFIFFKTELITAFHYVGTAFYKRPNTGMKWFLYDTNIPVFLLAGTTSLIALFRASFRRGTTALPALSIPALVYLAVVILCFGFEFSGRMVLQENVFAPWMLPSAFLAIGSALSLEVPNKTFSISLCIAAAAVLFWAACRMDPGVNQWWRYALGAGAVLSLLLPFGAWSTATATICILGLLAITYPTGNGWLPWDKARPNEQALYQFVKRAHQFVTVHSGDTLPSFWVSGDFSHLSDPLFVSIATPRTFMECMSFPASFPSPRVNRENRKKYDAYFPDLATAVGTHDISQGRRLFIIARGRDLVASASDAFHSVGLTVVPLDEKEIAPGVSIAVANIM